MTQTQTPELKTLGLRHAALYVRDPQASKQFYTRVLKMTIEWEPDPDNVYLTSDGLDNLAIHRREGDEPASGAQILDHLGFALPDADSVDAWYAWFKSHGVKILRDIKTHRDGARSFYAQHDDGVILQMIHHPPIAARSGREARSL